MEWRDILTNPKLILDTNVVRNRTFMKWLKRNYNGRIAVSPVAYMENLRQLLANDCDPKYLDDTLNDAKVKIDVFGKNEAIAAATIMNENIKVCECCHNIDWADTMVYSSAWNPPTLLVTNNISDFPQCDRVVTPETIVERYGIRET